MSQMIYLAEDEKNIRELMEAALTEEGFSVNTGSGDPGCDDARNRWIQRMLGASERGSGSPYSYCFRER